MKIEAFDPLPEWIDLDDGARAEIVVMSAIDSTVYQSICARADDEALCRHCVMRGVRRVKGITGPDDKPIDTPTKLWEAFSIGGPEHAGLLAKIAEAVIRKNSITGADRKNS